MSMVDMNYGVGSYRDLSGSRRMKKEAGGQAGEKAVFSRSMANIGAGRIGGKEKAGVAESARSIDGGGTEERKSVAESARSIGGGGTEVKKSVAEGAGSTDGESAEERKSVAESAGSAADAENAEVRKSVEKTRENTVSPEKTAGTAETAVWGADDEAKEKRDMSLAEYTWYIDRLISQMARKGYSRGNSVFVYISEEGYRAMQADPEYEAWVLSSIRDSYQFCRGMGGHDGYHSAHFFGASKEEYRGQSWHSGCSKCEQERRRERKLLQKKRLKALLKKRQEQKWLEKQRLEKLRLERLRLEKAVYKKLIVKDRQNRKRLEEEYREEALARREAASAFRIYQALARYNEQ